MTGAAVMVGGGCGGGGRSWRRAARTAAEEEEDEQNQVSPVAVLLAALRKSMVACSVDSPKDVISTVHHMEIGWPTNVKHVSHVTFDRFNGFLGLPVELEVHVPAPVPSASVSVFGVSAESMQCSYDSKGNSVPTILLLMQERLYSQGGLKAEGIFRINPENSEEENLRDQLNKGIVPDDIDVHCLAGLIKAWFRELPSGVLDGLSPEEVLQCNTEEESVELVKQLKPTESALLNWAIDLMADVVEEEELNKMDARNIAMVFAPNMTQMSDPLTALMHTVQVMNLLKTLILKTLREREETSTGGYSPMSSVHSSDCQSEDEYDSQQDMDSSGELSRTKSNYDDLDHDRDYVRTKSDYDDHDHNDDHDHDHDHDHNDDHDDAHCNHSSEGHAESLSEIEECFLKSLDENPEGCSAEPAAYSQEEFASPKSCSGCKVEPAISFTDIKAENSCLSSSSNGDESSTILTEVGSNVDSTSSPSTGSTSTSDDVEIIDKFPDSVSLMPMFSSG